MSVSVWISCGSLGVAIAALLTSLATYRRAGPRIRVKVSLPVNWRDLKTRETLASSRESLKGRLDLTISIFNKGLSPVDITAIRFAVRAGPTLAYVTEFTEFDIPAGSLLPYRLEGGSKRVWSLDIIKVAQQGRDAFESKINFSTTKIKFSMKGFYPFSPFSPSLFLPNIAFAVELGTGAEVLFSPSYLFWIRARGLLKAWQDSEVVG